MHQWAITVKPAETRSEPPSVPWRICCWGSPGIIWCCYDLRINKSNTLLHNVFPPSWFLSLTWQKPPVCNLQCLPLLVSWYYLASFFVIYNHISLVTFHLTSILRIQILLIITICSKWWKINFTYKMFVLFFIANWLRVAYNGKLASKNCICTVLFQ